MKSWCETPQGVMSCRPPRAWRDLANLEPTEHRGIVQGFSALPRTLDVLIVDTAAGIADRVLQFCQAAQQVLVVLRDEPASLTDTYALIKVLSRNHGVRNFRVLANMTRAGGRAKMLFKRLQRVTDRFLDVALEYAGDDPGGRGAAEGGAGATPGARGVSDESRGARLQEAGRVRRHLAAAGRSARQSRILLRAACCARPAPHSAGRVK